MSDRRATVISLISNELSKQDIRNLVARGDEKLITITSDYKIFVKGHPRQQTIETITYEGGREPYTIWLLKMHFGITN